MFPARTLTTVACLAFVAACGSSETPSAGKAKSFEEALGFDQASLNAREGKVQEAVRTCMKAEGFDYIPLDPSQGGMQVRVGPGDGGGGPGSDDPEFRKTKGYGISTGLSDDMAKPAPSDDPNQKIRDGLSEADKVAYEVALHGAEAAEHMKTDGDGGPNFVINRSEGPSSAGGNGGPSEDQGCFGKAQRETPGGPKDLGNSLQQMQERIDADTRLVTANQNWASCMAKAGFGSFEKPRDIIGYLIGKMQQLTGSTGNGITISSDTHIDQAALSQLQQEELTIARADDDCANKTGRAKIAKQVTEEAQQRFLDEHPDLTGGK